MDFVVEVEESNKKGEYLLLEVFIVVIFGNVVDLFVKNVVK